MRGSLIGHAILNRVDVENVVKLHGWLVFYGCMLLLGQLAGPLDILLSALIHTLLFVMLLVHCLILGPSVSPGRILPALALIALLRVLSLTTPVRGIPPVYWYVLIGAPLLAAIFQAIGLLSLSAEDVGLKWKHGGHQIFVAICGGLLSLPAYILLRPEPLISDLNWHSLLIATAVMFVFSGLVEELLFRGVVQHIAVELYGKRGVILAWLCFSMTYVGFSSMGYLLFMAVVALFLGYWVHLSGSLAGAVLAHTFINLGMLIVWPLAL